jgi:hypothetical protein
MEEHWRSGARKRGTSRKDSSMARRSRRSSVRVPARSCVQWIIVTLPLLTAGSLVGCGAGGSGKPTAHLSGNITIDGQSVPSNAWGTVNFRATGTGQAGQATSAPITDSEYDCPNVPIGNVDVFIQVVQPTGKMASEGGRSWPETRSLIADKYSNGFQLEVTDDNSSQDFELTSK